MALEKMVTERGMLIRQREKLGFTQGEVAERAGITLKQYQRFENLEFGFSSSSVRIVNAVLTVLELDPSAFAKGDYALRPLDEDDSLYQFTSEAKD